MCNPPLEQIDQAFQAQRLQAAMDKILDQLHNQLHDKLSHLSIDSALDLAQCDDQELEAKAFLNVLGMLLSDFQANGGSVTGLLVAYFQAVGLPARGLTLIL